MRCLVVFNNIAYKIMSSQELFVWWAGRIHWNGLIKYDRMVTGVGGSVGRETGRQIQDKDRQVQE